MICYKHFFTKTISVATKIFELDYVDFLLKIVTVAYNQACMFCLLITLRYIALTNQQKKFCKIDLFINQDVVKDNTNTF